MSTVMVSIAALVVAAAARFCRSQEYIERSIDEEMAELQNIRHRLKEMK